LRAQEWKAQVTSPSPDIILSWAQDAPEVSLTGELLKGEEKVVAKQQEVARLFLTGQIFASGDLIDTVPMWDDGTHGDKKAADGSYTATYRPPGIGEYQVRVRAQADILREGKAFLREFWSAFVTFKVVPMPYARLTQPEPGSELRSKTGVRARLLLLDKPFDEPDETLQATLLVTGEGQKRQIRLQRNGSLLAGSVAFSKRGNYHLQVSVTVRRGGQLLRTQSEVTEVLVTRLTYTWLIIATFFTTSFLLWPPKEPPLRFRHRVRFGRQVHELEPGQGKSLPETDSELVAEAEKREIRVRSRKGAQIRKGGLPQQEVSLREGERCQVGEIELHYERAEPLRAARQSWHRLLPNTSFRLAFFLCALGAFAYWLWQWRQFDH